VKEMKNISLITNKRYNEVVISQELADCNIRLNFLHSQNRKIQLKLEFYNCIPYITYMERSKKIFLDPIPVEKEEEEIFVKKIYKVKEDPRTKKHEKQIYFLDKRGSGTISVYGDIWVSYTPEYARLRGIRLHEAFVNIMYAFPEDTYMIDGERIEDNTAYVQKYAKVYSLD
jgi:hypothetical protein